jgi:hypothetical protein
MELVGLAILGSSFLAAMAFLLGFNKTLKLGNLNDIMAHMADVSIVAWAIADNGSAALVRDDKANLHLIRVMGDKVVVRKISGSDLIAVSDHHVRIESADLGFPALDFVSPNTNLSCVVNGQSEPSPA